MVAINVGLASQKIYCSHPSFQKEYYHFTYYSLEEMIYCTFYITFYLYTTNWRVLLLLLPEMRTTQLPLLPASSLCE